MFTTALFTIAKTTQMSIDGLMGGNKMRSMYYSVTKRNEFLMQAITWRDLETIILNEIIQAEKDKH